MPNIGRENKTLERDRDLIKQLKRGKICETVIQYAMDKYGLTHDYAQTIVYTLNAGIRRSVAEMQQEAAEYIVSTLINEIEECEDIDRKSKLKALELLAKVTKVTDDKPQININNYGFDFDGGGEDTD